MNNYINLLTLLLTLKRRCAEPSCFSRFADLNSGSIPVCGMILSERNVDFTAFLSLFCLLDIFAEKIKQMRISMLDQ